MIPKLISRTCHETILWYHVKQNGSKTSLVDQKPCPDLWYHVKQNGSKTSYLLFNMIGVDQDRFLGVEQNEFAIAFLTNVP